MIDLKTLNQMSAQEFVAALASIFEHSPWVAQRVAELRPFDSGIALHRALYRLHRAVRSLQSG